LADRLASGDGIPNKLITLNQPIGAVTLLKDNLKG
jgi:hypothetical protein